MKKLMIWLGVIGTLIFLTTRMFFHHVDGVRNEKKWYIDQLDFEFSGKLENHDSPDKVLFRLTKGQLNIEREKSIKAKLKYNGSFGFIVVSG
jgi:hypothetical protein